MGFSKQKYWRGFPLPSPGDLSNPGLQPRSFALHEMHIPVLGGENPLQEEMATHSGILAGKILWTEECHGLQSMESQSQTPLSTHSLTHLLNKNI